MCIIIITMIIITVTTIKSGEIFCISQENGCFSPEAMASTTRFNFTIWNSCTLTMLMIVMMMMLLMEVMLVPRWLFNRQLICWSQQEVTLSEPWPCWTQIHKYKDTKIQFFLLQEYKIWKYKNTIKFSWWWSAPQEATLGGPWRCIKRPPALLL